MAVHQNWWGAMIVKLLRCFMGRDHEVTIPSPSALLINPNRVRWQPLYEDLLPGLPNFFVLECILPRIPWYARPLLNATSRAWSNALDGLSASDRHRARTIYDNKHRDNELEDNLVKVQPINGSRYAISLYDPEQELWHNLPPLPCEKALGAWPYFPITLPPRASHPHLDSLPPTPIDIVAGFMPITEALNPIRVDYVHGKVIAAYMYDVPEDISMCGACVWMLDVEGGMWKWEERHSHTKRVRDLPIISNMVVAAGKLYILRQGPWEYEKPVIYNVASDEWEELPDEDYTYTTRKGLDHYTYTSGVGRDPDTGKLTKRLYALGPSWVVKILDPVTGTWKDYHGRKARS